MGRNSVWSTLTPFIAKINALGIRVPPAMVASVMLDQAGNVGNRMVRYESHET